MSMLKVIEVLAESEKSWEDAAQFAVKGGVAKKAGTVSRPSPIGFCVAATQTA